ncbi:ATP-binding protein [Saccharospirillum salsuginis]|uniref:ATPase n=1 Tax=Saccharospirillum salsuginis TaxID=418750 RepID=A0A918NCF1_9GAMM|nr:ATP-binding protein [Saccharospirillum salsuginis]GGX57425.1 ATPase [Saccharospirillum salsuginis]
MSEQDGNIDVIQASPTKRFFVDMLTRDIELNDAILDLLDNCVDGIQRTIHNTDKETTERPYEGYWAKITVSEDKFTIEDNCGGIPRDIAKNYAFRFGRPDDRTDGEIPTVGIYGIGMKRAIFKMGLSSTIESKHDDEECYKVNIKPEWLKNDEDWELRLLEPEANQENVGTKISISNLHDHIREKFKHAGEFNEQLSELVSTHYTYIIQNGFNVIIDEQIVTPQPLDVLASSFDDYENNQGILPFIYEGTKNGVQIRIVVGFLAQPPGESEVAEYTEAPRKKEQAGWTIIANDRVVLYKDRTRLTGWGTGTVPSYHPQFRDISGVVEFSCNDAEKLPINTTKRGLEAGDELYLYVKDFMCEGLKIFTQHTNIWKGYKEKEKEIFDSANAASIRSVTNNIKSELWVNPKKNPNEKKFIPKLPKPKSETVVSKWIRFSKKQSDIKKVSQYLFDNDDIEPSTVGEKCFDLILEDSKEDLE